MPDSIQILYLILVAAFGWIIGFLIGLEIKKREYKPALEKIWDNIEKVFDKIKPIEKEFSGNEQVKNKESSSYNPTDITITTINQNILEISDRLEKINQQIKSSNSTDRKKTKKNEIVSSVAPIQPKPKPDKNSSENLETISTSETSSDNNQLDLNDYNHQPESLSSQITTLYNRGISERSERDLFWKTFSITRIGNINAVAQRLGEVSAPDFREAGNGDFLAIENASQNYFVVPLFDTTITSSAFNEGGIGYAFDCFNYDSQSARSIVRVNKAAIFRREGEQWFLIDDGKGELVLQN